MILRPIKVLSRQEREALSPKVGDTVVVVGTRKLFKVQSIGMRYFRLKSVETGEPIIVKRNEAVKYTPPPVTEAANEDAEFLASLQDTNSGNF